MKYADNSIVTNPGSPIKTVYGPKVQKDGSVEIVPVGKENFDAYINSWKESTDMSFIIAKLQQGDTSVLQKHVGMYGDFTKVPSTFAEVLQLQIDAQRVFDRLPVETKKKFDNDVNKFIASAGSDEWLGKMDEFLPASIKEIISPAEAVEDVVKE